MEKNKKRVSNLELSDLIRPESIVTDPFGSYTGLTKTPDEKPVQDADDL